MAKIVEDVIVLKFSRIVKDNDADPVPVIANDSVSGADNPAINCDLHREFLF